MNPRVKTLRTWFVIAATTASLSSHAELDFAITIDPAHVVSSTLPVIAAPVDFNVILIDESTVEFSWNPELLDGSEVEYFNVWDRELLLTQTQDNRWQLGGIDRNNAYDFSVSAVTVSGVETRRSSRVYYDLPQLDITLPDSNNHYLPPLENLRAEVVDEDSVNLTWSAAAAHWSWADPSEYSYAITIGGHWVDVVDEPFYTYTGLTGQGPVWLGVSAFVDGLLSSRQPNLVLVDISNPPGTVSNGFAAYNSLFGLRNEVYSSSAIELFWEASQFPNVSHVYINGELVARMNDGYSLFIEDLPPGERFLVSVGEGWPYDADPPYDWPLLHDYPLMHAWIDMPPGIVDNVGNLEPVTGLRADVYSSTAAEVFWDRSDVVPARYRIYLNGQFLYETDAISWYLDDLADDSQYTIGVSTIAFEGIETDAVETTFRTFGEFGTTPSQCRIDGLMATVYSATAAEVFWNRKPAGSRFDILLNGEFQANTDAVSWFSDGFEPGSTHQVTLKVASDECLDETFPVSFQLNESYTLPPDDSTSVPTMPGALSVSVYSSTALELFWEPSTDDGWIIGYDILRDGIAIAERLDATSYFDETLMGAQEYTYEVVAIDNNGNRSPTAIVTASTPGSEPGMQTSSIINRQNHVELIGAVFQNYVGDDYIDPLETISSFTITGRNPDGSFIGVFDCESGGFEQDLNPTSTNSGVFFTFDFDECLLDGVVHNGYVSGQDSARGLHFNIEQYSARQGSETAVLYSGFVQKWISQTAFFDRVHSFDTADFAVEAIKADYDLTLAQMSTSFAYGSQTNGLDVAWLRGGFSARLDIIDGTLLTVSTPVEFTYRLNTRTDGMIVDGIQPSSIPVTDELRNGWTFSSGQLELIAEDGSTLRLDADNGNAATVSITITSGREVESLEQPWSLWTGVLRFKDYPELTR